MDETTTEIVDEHLDVESYQLHVTGTLDDIEVWINRTFDFSGLAIGGGETRRAAINDAIFTLEQALRGLKGLK